MHTPAHSQMAGALSYWSPAPLPPGSLVRVPLGQRELLGLVWSGASDAAADAAVDPAKLRPITAVLDTLPPLNPHWRALISFAASYYQRAAGEVALAALPPQLRDMSSIQLGRRLKKLAKAASGSAKPALDAKTTPTPEASRADQTAVLTPEQQQAIDQFHQHPGPFLLFGATGSGKTEVFMHCTAALLASSADAQALVMVPEINLTPQLEARFKARFCGLYGEDAVVSMHSGMTPAQRLNSWLAAHSGSARVVLGTRMAVFASMPQLQLIVVDEEHDPSYKSGEGARYSARDLAIYRGRLEGAKVFAYPLAVSDARGEAIAAMLRAIPAALRPSRGGSA